MKANFWKKLPSGFAVLAPMEDVTDTVFRRILISVARPEVFFTEFTNVDGICALTEGHPPEINKSLKFTNGLLQRLVFSKVEKPVVAQIWGTDPKKFLKATRWVSDSGFDGVDINLGCPQRRITKTGGAAALIGEYDQVRDIIEAVKEGAGGLPVSVKTRIGKKTIMTEEWIGFLLQQGLAAITVHGRTAAQMSKTEADWEEIGKAVALRDKLKSETLIIGNGDVKDQKDAREKYQQYKTDGVMIGRGIFANPVAFDKNGRILTPKERIQLLSDHLALFSKVWGDTKDFSVMKKFVKMYISGWEGAQATRKRMMETRKMEDLQNITEEECRGMR